MNCGRKHICNHCELWDFLYIINVMEQKHSLNGNYFKYIIQLKVCLKFSGKLLELDNLYVKINAFVKF